MESILTRIEPWIPAAAMMAVSLISYIDRNTLALLAPTILSEVNLTNEQYGWIVSAFSLAYMVGNPVWGVLLDRTGVRNGMVWAVGFWSIASACHAFASGFVSFALARCALGFGEGATFPGGLRTTAMTLPRGQRSRGVALAYSGGSLGAVITPLVITPIALQWGWRGAFLFTGLIGLLWLVLWRQVSRRIPVHTPASISAEAPRPSLRDPALWAFISAYALGALPLAFVLYGTAIYLGQVRQFTQAQLGGVLWIPPLGWETGYFFWGWVIDKKGPVRGKAAQALFAILTLLSLPLMLSPQIEANSLFMLSLFFAMFVAAGFIILAVAYATEVFSPQSSGLIAGLGAGSWSAAVAVLMPVIGRLFDQARFDLAFAIAAVVPLAGCGGWYLCDRLHRARLRAADLAIAPR